jgi:hypothetical protein
MATLTLGAPRTWQCRVSARHCPDDHILTETWQLQSKDGPVTVEALEAILSRSMVPILRQMEDKQPELVMALLQIGLFPATIEMSRCSGYTPQLGHHPRRLPEKGTRCSRPQAAH